MWDWVRIVGWSVVSAVRSRRNLALENIALRHQLMVLQRQFGRPRLKNSDRLVWVCLRRLWHGWHRALVVVQPATVVKWHRNGFRAYWRWKSRPEGGRPRWARWSLLPGLAGFIIATPAGWLPDILPSRG